MAFRLKDLMVDLAQEDLGIARRPAEAGGCTGSSCRAAATKDGRGESEREGALAGAAELGLLREQLRQAQAAV
jgi:hypothetical protein